MTTSEITLIEPGIYSIPAEQYHADPCPEPSLSGSIAIPLVHASPRHAWLAHPRLNPDHFPSGSSVTDLGSLSHALLLGAGASLEIIDADDFRTKAAQVARDEARAAGRIPCLRHKYDEALVMADEARKFLSESGISLADGKPERTLVWRDKGAWCRGMIDWLSDDMGTVIDYKTTGTSVSPWQFERHLYEMSYHLKTAFYERGLNVLDPERAGRRQFLILAQENFAPFACSLVVITEEGMVIGRKQAAYALLKWRTCLPLKGPWPGYPPRPVGLSPPPWASKAWLEREMVDPDATGETGQEPAPPHSSENQNSVVGD